MDNKQTLIVVVAVAVIAIVCVAAYFVLSDDDNDSKDVTVEGDEDTVRLVVYGNANLDDYLDDKDTEYLQKIVDGDAPTNKYADANGDGKVDQADVDYLKSILDGKADRIYYNNLNGHKSYVSQPVTKIGADYWPCMDAIMAIGAQDILTHVDSGIYGGLDGSKYGSFDKSAVTNFGSGFGNRYDLENVVKTGVDAMVCGSEEIYFVGIEDRFTDDTRIDMIRLPFWEGDDVDSAVITLAYLLNKESYIQKAHEYLDFEDNITKIINDNISKVSKKATGLVVYIGNSTESSLEVEIECRGCGSFEWSVLGGIDNVSSDINKSGVLASSSMYYQTDQEYVIGKNPDFVFILGKAGMDRTAEQAQASYDAGSAYLTTTKASQDNHIWVCSSGLTSGTMQKVMALYLACNVYTDAFSGIDCDKYLQDFVDTFTLANVGKTAGSDGYFDVTKEGTYLYMPKTA